MDDERHGHQPLSSATFPGAESPGTTVTLDAGAYSVTEIGWPLGLHRDDLGGCTGTAVAGGTYTCTITNDDQAPTLTVIKHVINDNGGTATAGQWTMTVTGGPASSGHFPAPRRPRHDAGTLTLPAAAHSGRSERLGLRLHRRATSARLRSPVALGVGGSYTCTITNDDQAVTLHVIKHVVNDNGGTATASAWTLSVTGGSPSPASFAGAESPGHDGPRRRRLHRSARAALGLHRERLRPTAPSTTGFGQLGRHLHRSPTTTSPRP